LYRQLDVMLYLVSRRLELGISADVFALPPPLDQRAIVAALAEEFGREPLAQSGLIKGMPAGEPDLSRLVWPEHRLAVIWRTPEGSAQTIERRYTGSRDTERRWVFPAQRGAEWPLGWHELARAEADRPVILVEGPSDLWAARARAFVNTFGKGHPLAVVLALPAATKLRPEWLRALMGRRVFVALDTDKAGEEASSAILSQLEAVGIAAERARPLAPAKDWAAAWRAEHKMTETEARAEAQYLATERAALVEGAASG
jgi:5S rRNA maturation endonuclease (ribonuclease M5)